MKAIYMHGFLSGPSLENKKVATMMDVFGGPENVILPEFYWEDHRDDFRDLFRDIEAQIEPNEKVVIVGTSMGGAGAIYLGRTLKELHPTLELYVVAINPLLTMGQSDIHEKNNRFLRNFKTSNLHLFLAQRYHEIEGIVKSNWNAFDNVRFPIHIMYNKDDEVLGNRGLAEHYIHHLEKDEPYLGLTLEWFDVGGHRFETEENLGEFREWLESL